MVVLISLAHPHVLRAHMGVRLTCGDANEPELAAHLNVIERLLCSQAGAVLRPRPTGTVWKAGTNATVRWQLTANHGGGEFARRPRGSGMPEPRPTQPRRALFCRSWPPCARGQPPRPSARPRAGAGVPRPAPRQVFARLVGMGAGSDCSSRLGRPCCTVAPDHL